MKTKHIWELLLTYVITSKHLVKGSSKTTQMKWNVKHLHSIFKAF